MYNAESEKKGFDDIKGLYCNFPFQTLIPIDTGGNIKKMASLGALRHRQKGEENILAGRSILYSVLCRVYIVSRTGVTSDQRSILIGGQGDIACGQAISRLNRRLLGRNYLSFGSQTNKKVAIICKLRRDTVDFYWGWGSNEKLPEVMLWFRERLK